MTRVVAVDLETHRIRPEWQAPRPVCLSWAEDAGGRGLMLADEIDAFLGPLLEDPGVLIVAHNSSFDFSVLLAWSRRLRAAIWGAYEAGRVRCTLIREKLLDIREGNLKGWARDAEGAASKIGYGLGELADRRLGLTLDKRKELREGFGRLEGVPISRWPRESIEYAAQDSHAGLLLWLDQAERGAGYGGDDGETFPTERLDARADLALRLAAIWGMAADVPRVEEWRRRQAKAMIEAAGRLVEAGVVRAPSKAQMGLFGDEPPTPDDFVRDDAAVRRLVEASWPAGAGEIPRTPTGKIQANKDTIVTCAHPTLVLLSEWIRMGKWDSTWAEPIAESGGVVHAYLDVLGASSGRMSSSGPCLHNLPRAPGLRECLVARPGKAFAGSDFDSQEMRTWAQSCHWIAGASRLAEAYRADPRHDPHLQAAANQALRISIAEAKARKAADDPVVLDARQTAKIANFGLPGGMGVGGIIRYARGYGQVWDGAKAQAAIAGWQAEYPEQAAFFRHVRSVVGPAGEGKMTVPPTGFERGGVTYTECANGYFQSPAAHATKHAVFEVARRCHMEPGSALYGAHVVNVVHDEIVVEADEDGASEAADELAAIMVERMAAITPDVPPMASPATMRRWSKQAKGKRGPDGRLIIWDG